jgi:hypothetical protein
VPAMDFTSHNKALHFDIKHLAASGERENWPPKSRNP